MIEMYQFLAAIPEKTLRKKQEQVIDKFCCKGIGKHCVYFISDGFFVKIGRATNVFERLRELQIANPSRLIILAVYPSCKADVADDEKMYHELFEEKRVRGEWFYLTDSDFYENGKARGTIRFPDYFSSEFEKYGYYKKQAVIQNNINDRLHGNYKKAYPN